MQRPFRRYIYFYKQQKISFTDFLKREHKYYDSIGNFFWENECTYCCLYMNESSKRILSYESMIKDTDKSYRIAFRTNGTSNVLYSQRIKNNYEFEKNSFQYHGTHEIDKYTSGVTKTSDILKSFVNKEVTDIKSKSNVLTKYTPLCEFDQLVLRKDKRKEISDLLDKLNKTIEKEREQGGRD